MIVNLFIDDVIQEEYRKTKLLFLFKQFCERIDRDISYQNRVKNLFRQTFDKIMTTKIIMERDFDFSLTEDDCHDLYQLIEAKLRKINIRNLKFTNLSMKQDLMRKQNHCCAIGGQSLPNDFSLCHVDHIIPFKFVGDELKYNYQVLCEHCNKCKSDKLDYKLKQMIKLRENYD